MDRKKLEDKIKKFLDFMEKECPECLAKMEKCCEGKGCCD